MSATVLPQFCPGCGTSLSYQLGLCGHRLAQAVALQTARVGAEIGCQNCGHLFVISRTVPIQREPPRRARSRNRRPQVGSGASSR